jgi:hypothetical protein
MELPDNIKNRLILEYRQLAKSHVFVEYAPKKGISFLVGHRGVRRLTYKESALLRIERLEREFDLGDRTYVGLSWRYCTPGLAKLAYLGQTYTHQVRAEIMLVGRVGDTLLFKKFVSHPFYQRGRRR